MHSKKCFPIASAVSFPTTWSKAITQPNALSGSLARAFSHAETCFSEAEAPQDGSAKPADKPQADAGQGEARMGYGNARDADGAMEQDTAHSDSADASATATAADGDEARPDVRARADAARPLGGA